MNKTTYLAELAIYLKRLPKADFDDCMAYFIELFEDAGPEGEAELIASLGTPQEAAAEILDQILEKEIEKVEVTNSKDRYVSVNLPDFDRITFDLVNLDVLVSQSEDDQYSLSYFKPQDGKQLPFDYQVVDGQLQLRSVEEKEKRKYSFSLFSSLMRLNWATHTLVIKMPKGSALQQLEGRLGAGDLTVQDMVIEEGQLSTGAGDLNLTGLEARSLSCQTGSGEISLQASQVSRAQLATGAGDMDLSHVRLEGGKLSTGAGDLSIKDSQLTDVKLELASGDMEIGRSQLSQLSGQLAAGDIVLVDTSIDTVTLSLLSGDISAKYLIFVGEINLSTLSGDIEIAGLNQLLDQLSLEVKVDFGGLDLSWDQASRKIYQHQVSNPIAKIGLSSKMGDISLT
ncbi:DUF4097 family beta strand repeat-containing protein [Streptococcus ovuberis]|uniref:DUF4097 family beta strand repeat protein n=1 Tax=Streptococcus ovuberis TaxID=1936207 RepID=A0A7X6N0K8_9STRE|nr:DUF4097 family beta strand repeat-containing protein [Streptococcus ovuberis]NKZ21321.1 DUF4097 family beta strand repeat protein [Streptococcus ovuberis]